MVLNMALLSIIYGYCSWFGYTPITWILYKDLLKPLIWSYYPSYDCSSYRSFRKSGAPNMDPEQHPKRGGCSSNSYKPLEPREGEPRQPKATPMRPIGGHLGLLDFLGRLGSPSLGSQSSYDHANGRALTTRTPKQDLILAVAHII